MTLLGWHLQPIFHVIISDRTGQVLLYLLHVSVGRLPSFYGQFFVYFVTVNVLLHTRKSTNDLCLYPFLLKKNPHRSTPVEKR